MVSGIFWELWGNKNCLLKASENSLVPYCKGRRGKSCDYNSKKTNKTKKMDTSDFTTTILVDQSPKEAFNAVNNVRGWWSEEIEGDTKNLDEEFTYHYKDVHSCQIKLIEVIPDKRVVWFVKQNNFNFTKDPSEWTGTKISFEISEKDKKTQIRFTHIGLVPEYECFNLCSNAWSKYINQSLWSLISSGKGQPNQKETE